MKLWLGRNKEIYEGDFVTLFIGERKTSCEEIENALTEYNGIKHIYFGAANSKVNETVLEQMLRSTLIKDITIDVEIDIERLHKYDIELLKQCVVSVRHSNKNYHLLKEIGSPSYIKLQTVKPACDKCLYLSEFSDMKKINVNDKMGDVYPGDIIINAE